MRAMSLALRHELVGLSGVIERNIYLVKRYIWWDVAFFFWTVANTLTIVFIAKGIPAAGGHIDVEQITTILLIGAVIWAYLGIIFEILTETVAWERWEGTIEYTFMAPLSRPVPTPSSSAAPPPTRPARKSTTGSTGMPAVDSSYRAAMSSPK